jgi:uncharacterized protein (TIGR03437 family)
MFGITRSDRIEIMRVRNLFILLLYASLHSRALAQSNNSFLITTVAGNGRLGLGTDGIPATTSPFHGLYGVAIDNQGNLFIGEDSRVRRVDSNGIITTVAGGPTAGYGGDGGPATDAKLSAPLALATDSSGNLYIGEGSRIRLVTKLGIISTLATALSGTLDLANDVAGNLYIVGDSVVLKRAPNGIITSFAGTGKCTWSGFVDGAAATGTEICGVRNVVAGPAGDIYVSVVTSDQCQILLITSDAKIHVFAGSGKNGGGGDGPAKSVQLGSIGGLTVDSAGAVYFSESDTQRIRRVRPDGNIETVAGGAGYGFSGDGGLALGAQLSDPEAIVADPKSGFLYFADGQNYRVRELVPSEVGLPSPVIPPGAPSITSLLNSATFTSQVAFSSIVSILGNSLADSTVGAAALPLPSQLAGTEVLACNAKVGGSTSWLDCVPMGIAYASPTQINAVFPDAPISPLGPSTVEIRVRNRGVDDADTIAGKPLVVTVIPVAPGIYREGYDCPFPAVCSLVSAASGAHSVPRGAIVDETGALVTSANPVLVRKIYSVYLTGLGIANSTSFPYINPASGIALAAHSTVYPDVLYLGPAPGYPGLYQINFTLPQDLRKAFSDDGNLPICSTLIADLKAEMQLGIFGLLSSTGQDTIGIPVLAHPNELDCTR